jgi:hypothetical protein
LPAAYGLRQDSRVLGWSEVDDRLRAAPHYWICTVGSGGEPVPRPVDGMWLDGHLFFGGDPRTRWRHNLDKNPKASVNLDDGVRAVILHGEVSLVRPDNDLATRLADVSNAKFGTSQKASDYAGQEICMFTASVVFAWNALHDDATRFTF